MDPEEVLEKLRNYLVPGLVVGLGLTLYFQNYEPFNILKYTLVGFSVFAVREIGQRIMARFMGASVQTEFSVEGTSLTIMTGVIAVIAATPLAILIPSTNTFSQTKYEHWGKSVDAMWSKREYWIASAGTSLLTAVTMLLFWLEQNLAVQAFATFTITNMIPLRDLVIEGDTDGSYILFHSGLTWLLLAGINIIIFGLATF